MAKRKKELGVGLRFAAGTGIIGLATYLLLGVAMPLLENATASMAATVLSLFGTAFAEASLVHYNTIIVKVIPLCVGDIEIAVLTGAILSTADRPINDRIAGIIAAFAFVMLINAFRIAGTLLAWETWGIGVIEAIHSTLFKMTLVIAIVGFYAAWYLREGISERLKLSQLLSEK